VKNHSSRDTAPAESSSQESEARAPGKQTLTSHVQQMPAESDSTVPPPPRRLQLKGAGPAAGASGQSFVDGISGVHAAAARGVSGPSTALPHHEAIQRSFGRHDVSGIAAHTDDNAAAGAREMGASAFATGNHVAFAGAPSLHTAAHEAAHVVQQRAGVHLAGGVGAAGDQYERHADAVAARVVQGQSAAALLDQHAGGGGAGGAAGGGAAIQRDDTNAAAAIDYEAEFNSFSQRDHVEDGLAGYKDIRELFIQEFGSVAKANAYYSAMSHPTFLGQRVTVHQQLAAALAAAEVKLGQGSSDPAEQQQYEAIAAAVKDGFAGKSAGGFNIRRNRNAKGRLSDHSFGTAIDIRAKFNPNLAEDKKRRAAQKKNPNKPERFDEKMIVAVTDRDIGSDLARMREGGKTDELVDPAADIQGASGDFKSAFLNESAVEHTMLEYLTKRLSIDVEADFSIDKVKDAAKSGKAGRKELSRYLGGHLGSMPDAIEQQEREDRESFFANGGTEKRWKELEKQRRDANLKKADADRARRAEAYRKDAELTAKGVSDDEIQKRVWDPFWAGEGKRLDADVSAITDRAAQMLLKMWATYEQSLQTGKQDKDGDGRRDPQTEGEPGTIAAHGFMDLPAKLVAAMSGSDGGNLKWLGAYNQDFMHFELKSTPPRK